MKVLRMLVATGCLWLAVSPDSGIAQEITFRAQDYPSLNTRNVMVMDTSGHVPVVMTGPGTNQSWIFTEALHGDTIVHEYLKPSEAPFYKADFAGADWAIRTKQWLSIDAMPTFGIPKTAGFFDLCYFEKLRNDTVQGIGLGTTTPFNSGGYPFSKPSTNMVFPMAVGSGWTNSYSTQAAVKVSGINATLVAKDSSICVVDASGSLTVPMGTFECLRIKSKRFVTVKAYVLFFEVPVTNDTLIQYDWWTRETGMVLQVVSRSGEKNEQFTNASMVNRLYLTDRTITLVSPLGGDRWEAGSIQTIQWTSRKVDLVKLEYSTDGIGWNTILSSLPSSSGQHSWTLPDVENSTACLIRVSDVSQPGIAAVSGSAFTIFKKTLALVSPNGGENWQAGTVQTIQWNAQNVTSINLHYSTDQGVTWTAIQSNLPASPNQCAWTVPDTNAQQCLVRIEDVSQAGLSDANDAVFSIFKKTLALVSPNGGENWQAGTVQTIQWNAQNVTSINLHYSTDQGVTWTAIQSNLPASPNQCAWTVPDTNAQQCLVRIEDVSQAGLSDANDAVFSIFKKTLALVSPNGGENWQAGTVQTIQWNAQNVDRVKLKYSTNLGKTWSTIQLNLAASLGQCSWTLPNANSQNCLVRISDVSQADLLDQSDTPFTISNAALALVSPNGGENWQAGTSQTIQWNAQNVISIKLDFSLDQGVSWTTIQPSLPASPNQYSWTVPDTTTQQCLVRISDVPQSGLSDASDAVFSIFKKTLALISPNGGENWQAGSTRTIQWNSQNVDSIKLDYSTDQGVNWTTIQPSLPSTSNQYAWTVPDTIFQQCLVRVADVSQSGLSDSSDAVFSIFKKSLVLISPNGGENWQTGTNQTIQWNAQNIALIKLEYSTDQGVNWTTIQTSLPSIPNQFFWTAPADTISRHCLVRVSDVSQAGISDTSDAVFSIFKKTLSLVSPNGGENWIAGSVQTVRWNSQNVDSVKLEYASNQNGAWTTIRSSFPASAGHFTWTTPDVNSPNCIVRVSDVSQPGIADTSDAVFTIFKKTLALVSPNGGEILQTGDTVQVRWESVGIDTVHLLISYFQGASWDTLAASILSNGEHDWIVPNADTKQGLIRIEDKTDGAVHAQSAGTFTIKPTQPSAVDGSYGIPDRFCLSRNYPNPFNPMTHIRFDLPRASELSLLVYDMQGRVAAVLYEGRINSGFHEVTWDASSMPTGVYIIRMKAEGFSQARKMFLMK